MVFEFMTTLSTMWLWILGIIGIVLIVFIIWQFVTMLVSKRIRATEKGIWTILFIMFSLLTAIIWFIAKRLKK